MIYNMSTIYLKNYNLVENKTKFNEAIFFKAFPYIFNQCFDNDNFDKCVEVSLNKLKQSHSHLTSSLFN